MGLTNIATTTARTGNVPQEWEAKTMVWAYKEMWASRLIGTVIREVRDLQKNAGDVVTSTIVAPLVGTGKTDSQQRGDGGEALVTFSDKITLHANKHECGYDSEITQQRTKLDLRDLSKEGLGGWAAQTLDDKFLYCASGLASPDGVSFAAQAPSTNRKYYGGQAADGTLSGDRGDDNSITTADKMGPEVLSVIKRRAEIASAQSYSKIRPIMWNGKKLYLCIMHNYQLRDFRATTSFKNKAYYVDAKVWKNPLTNGAEFIWDGVICYSWEKILLKAATESFESGDAVNTGVTVARALFMGADAIGLAWGKQKMRWSEYLYPHGDGWSAGVEMVQGYKKYQYNNEDYGVYLLDTAAAADS